METSGQQPGTSPSAQPAGRVYVLYPFQKADYSAGMNPGPGQGGPSGPPCPALIHQLSNSGIEISATEVKTEAEVRVAVTRMIEQMTGRLRTKMFAIRSRIEWMDREGELPGTQSLGCWANWI